MSAAKVVILAGSLGSRLSEEIDLRPKPMVEIGGRPILWRIIKIRAERFRDLPRVQGPTSSRSSSSTTTWRM
jgi:choline kinase